MKCFYHNEHDAVGICKTCNKGICHECAVDVSNGIACKGSCVEEVKILNQLLDKNKTVFQKTAGVYTKNAIIYLSFGVVFLVAGFLIPIAPLRWFITPFGVISILAAVLMYLSGKKINSSSIK
ncbi:MAG: hypothetical protein APF81_11695 [Desulfosporosinus sp. BRH_c37]|nr:MAG: hypothetical protein APF81_11695 [Desulfosporosinus sp. BRH_c37]